MAQSTTPEYVDFIPYDPEQDALNGNVPYDEVSIRGIPPSSEPEPDHEFNQKLRHTYRTRWDAHRSEIATEQLKKNLIKELDELSVSYLHHIRSWQMRCSEQGFWFSDDNRLARLLICKNHKRIFKVLRENSAGFDATYLDILGRSIIFYALWPFPDNSMLRTVTSEFRAGSMPTYLSYRDNKDHGLLHYATKLKGVDALESLLTICLDSRIDSSLYYESVRMSRQKPFDGTFSISVAISLLLGFKMLLLNGLPESSTGFVDFRDFSDLQRFPFSELKEWQSLSRGDSEIGWLHFPWEFGIPIFSLLRRCGQEGMLLTNTPVIDVVGNPYTDPSYLSNLVATLDPQQHLGRQVYMALPYLTLRDKFLYTLRKKTIRKWKESHIDYFTQSRIHPDRTLDETYFPSLSFDSLEARENSQVVSREHHEVLKPILVVPNLWIWRIGRSIITTYSSSSNGGELSRDDDGLKFPKSRVLISRRPGVQIGLIVARHISTLGNRQTDWNFPPTLDIFERSVVRILEDVDDYTDPKKTLGLEMEREHGFMLRISDIREELVMIQEILKQQLGVFDSMVEDLENNDPDIKELLDASPGPRGEELHAERQQAKAAWKKVKSARRKIEKYQTRVKKIDADAERVEKRIQDQLNLKRTHFSIKDARTSLLLGTAVIGFTVITVIFAPLAFMTALFALPIDILVRNQFSEGATEPTATYTTRYIGTWFAVAEVGSLVVTILLVWVCLWLLGGTESFTAMRGDRIRETDYQQPVYSDYSDYSEGSKVPDISLVQKVKDKLAHGQRNLRDRAANVVRRRKVTLVPESQLDL